MVLAEVAVVLDMRKELPLLQHMVIGKQDLIAYGEV